MNDRFKTVLIGGREFVIEKFSAMTGLKLARLIFAKFAPMLPMLTKGDGEIGEQMLFELIGEALSATDDREIESAARMCLMACSVNLPAGRQAVMDEFGNYGVENVEHDIGLVLRLCTEALAFGAADFFLGGAQILGTILRSHSSPPHP